MNIECSVFIEEILKEMEPKIKKSLYNTSMQEREDLEQEIRLSIIEIMEKNPFSYTPGFWELAKQLS